VGVGGKEGEGRGIRDGGGSISHCLKLPGTMIDVHYLWNRASQTHR
jgi:hypothetical protein